MTDSTFLEKEEHITDIVFMLCRLYQESLSEVANLSVADEYWILSFEKLA